MVPADRPGGHRHRRLLIGPSPAVGLPERHGLGEARPAPRRSTAPASRASPRCRCKDFLWNVWFDGGRYGEFREHLLDLAASPASCTGIAALALVGLVVSIVRWIRVGVLLAPAAPWPWPCCSWSMPEGRLWNARLLPFFYLALCLLAAHRRRRGRPGHRRPSSPTGPSGPSDRRRSPRLAGRRPRRPGHRRPAPRHPASVAAARPRAAEEWMGLETSAGGLATSSATGPGGTTRATSARRPTPSTTASSRRWRTSPPTVDSAAGGPCGVRERPAQRLRHADGADAPAVLDRRLHRVDGGPLLRGVVRPRRTTSSTSGRSRPTARAPSGTCPTAPATTSTSASSSSS